MKAPLLLGLMGLGVAGLVLVTASPARAAVAAPPEAVAAMRFLQAADGVDGRSVSAGVKTMAVFAPSGGPSAMAWVRAQQGQGRAIAVPKWMSRGPGATPEKGDPELVLAFDPMWLPTMVNSASYLVLPSA